MSVSAAGPIPAEIAAGLTYESLGIRLRNVTGIEKTFCPWCHAERKNQADRSLSVDIDDGSWRCHNCGRVSGLNQEARAQGLDPQPVPGGRRERDPHTRHVSLPSDVLEEWAEDYLSKRMISVSTAKRYGVTSRIGINQAEFLYFPYLVDGEIVNFKQRMVGFAGERTNPETGKPYKTFQQAKGARRTMYGLHVCPPAPRAVVIVEGELEALSCYEAGWSNSISLPDGAAKHLKDGKLAALDDPAVASLLAQAEIIVIATDADEAGQECAEALLAKIGDPVRCWRVRWPEGSNDANDVLRQYGPERLNDVLTAARPVDLPGLHDFQDDVPNLLLIRSRGYTPGVSTGDARFDTLMTLHKSATYVWTGIPSHGKTSFLMDLLMKAARSEADWRGAIFSPEMGSSVTILRKLVQMAANLPVLPGELHQIGEESLLRHVEWVREHFILIDAAHRVDEGYAGVGLEEILERAEKAKLRHGLDFLVLDPWNRIDAGRPKNMTETEYVAYAMNAIGRFNQRHEVSVHVVAHPTKQEAGKSGEQEGMPTPYSISGSAHWYAMADFILGVHREKYDPERLGITTVRTWKVREEGDQGNLGSCEFRYDTTGRRFYALDIPFAAPGTDSVLEEALDLYA